jgi:hypothetical protein
MQTSKLVTNIHSPWLIQWPFKQEWAMPTHGILSKFLCIRVSSFILGHLQVCQVGCGSPRWMTLDTSSFQIIYKFHYFLNLGIAIVDVTNWKE